MTFQERLNALQSMIPVNGCDERYPLQVMKELGFELTVFQMGTKAYPWQMIWKDAEGNRVEIMPMDGVAVTPSGSRLLIWELHFVGTEARQDDTEVPWIAEFYRPVLGYGKAPMA